MCLQLICTTCIPSMTTLPPLRWGNLSGISALCNLISWRKHWIFLSKERSDQFKKSCVTFLFSYSLAYLCPYSSWAHCLHTFTCGDHDRQKEGQFRGLLGQKYCLGKRLAKKEIACTTGISLHVAEYEVWDAIMVIGGPFTHFPKPHYVVVHFDWPHSVEFVISPKRK